MRRMSSEEVIFILFLFFFVLKIILLVIRFDIHLSVQVYIETGVQFLMRKLKSNSFLQNFKFQITMSFAYHILNAGYFLNSQVLISYLSQFT